MTVLNLRTAFQEQANARREVVHKQGPLTIGCAEYDQLEAELVERNEILEELAEATHFDGTLASIYALRDVVAEFGDYGLAGGLQDGDGDMIEHFTAKLLAALFELEKAQQ